MPKTIEKLNQAVSLRRRAVEHLCAGNRPDDRRSSPTDAMAVLMGLSSSPATAGDALAVLHELQVHQVELDLQNEELSASRVELEHALARQRYGFEHAPAGFLIVDATTMVCDINRAAARLLGAPRDQLLGQALASFLSIDSGNALHHLLAQARDRDESDASPGLLLSAGPSGAEPRRWQVMVNRDSTPGWFLLVMVPSLG